MQTATTSDHEVFGDLDVGYAAPRELVREIAVSDDGTPIAFERSGSGPPLVLVGGGLNDRAMFSPFAALMSQRFTVLNYDRRGRGDSGTGDLGTWSVRREVEDLAAIVEAAGEPCHVFANCTGGMVAIHAAAAGLAIRRMALYEPPYGAPGVSVDLLEHLRELILADRREEVVTIFCRDVVRLVTEETIDRFRSHPAWAAFHTMVPSTYYDGYLGRPAEPPFEALRGIAAPTLVMRGDEGLAAIHDACAGIARAMPAGELVTGEGYNHMFDQKAWAPLLLEYFGRDEGGR